MDSNRSDPDDTINLCDVAFDFPDEVVRSINTSSRQTGGIGSHHSTSDCGDHVVKRGRQLSIDFHPLLVAVVGQDATVDAVVDRFLLWWDQGTNACTQHSFG